MAFGSTGTQTGATSTTVRVLAGLGLLALVGVCVVATFGLSHLGSTFELKQANKETKLEKAAALWNTEKMVDTSSPLSVLEQSAPFQVSVQTHELERCILDQGHIKHPGADSDKPSMSEFLALFEKPCAKELTDCDAHCRGQLYAMMHNIEDHQIHHHRENAPSVTDPEGPTGVTLSTANRQATTDIADSNKKAIPVTTYCPGYSCGIHNQMCKRWWSNFCCKPGGWVGTGYTEAWQCADDAWDKGDTGYTSGEAYDCPSGTSLSKKYEEGGTRGDPSSDKRYKSIPQNGCGPESLISGWPAGYTMLEAVVDPAAMVTCCNTHDVEYSDCHISKASADNNFYDCMTEICDEEYGGWYWYLWPACEAKAYSLWSLVWDFGGEAFDGAKKGYCACE